MAGPIPNGKSGSSKASGTVAAKVALVARLHADRLRFGVSPRGNAADAKFSRAIVGMSTSAVKAGKDRGRDKFFADRANAKAQKPTRTNSQVMRELVR